MKGKECCDSKLEQGCSGEAPEARAARFPLIGEEAPDFTAKTTTGWLTLSEYGKDSWVILFSHPADFTPVCTTELSGFAVRKAEFTKLNAKLLGLSVDSISAHLGWVQNVKQKTGVYFDFPIIADMKMENVIKGLEKSLPERHHNLIPMNEKAIRRGMEIIKKVA